MSAQIWAALIAAVASLIVAIVTAFKTYRAQQALARLDSQLQEQRAERDARRDYEYEAKKRLYTQCEPIIFQAMELAENFRHRVLSLARSARTGDLLPDGIRLASFDRRILLHLHRLLPARAGRSAEDHPAQADHGGSCS